LEVIMLEKKRIARALAVVAGVSMFALAGPAAVADDDPAVTPSPEPSVVDNGNGSAGDNCVIVVRPEKVLKNGKVVPEKTRISKACVQAREENRVKQDERAQIREEIKANGGTWGAYVRQETMVKVASKLAERHEQVPQSSALGVILAKINSSLPEQFQIDIDAFCAQYDLIFADLIKDSGDDDDEGAEPETSPSASPEPEPEPSVS
jgi:hypothetical protein